jgi:DNA-binding MarR family transcriptional regulator
MTFRDETWYDEDSGPLVRLYARTGNGSAPAATPDELELNALVSRTGRPVASAELSPAESRILTLVVLPLSVSEIAAQLDLPIGPIRTMLRGLRDTGLVEVRRPADDSAPHVLQQLLAGLRSL